MLKSGISFLLLPVPVFSIGCSMTNSATVRTAGAGNVGLTVPATLRNR
jgi:hypothetical protein